MNSWPLPYQGSALPLSYIGTLRWRQSLIYWIYCPPKIILNILIELLNRLFIVWNEIIWAGDEGRTRDIQLGRLTLYQLSYSRITCGESRIRTYEGVANSFTDCSRWPLEYLPNIKISKSRWRDSNPRPADYKSAALASWATSAYYKKLFAK